MTEREQLPPIKFTELAEALLDRASYLVPAWMPGGRMSGHEWCCGSLSGGAGGKCSVNINTGAWADFSSEERGRDLISLYAAIHGLTMGKAAVQVARDECLEDVAGVQRSAAHVKPERPAPPPAAPKRERVDEGWRTVRPVPSIAPPPTYWHYAREAADIVRSSEYRVGAELHGYVVRFKTSDGGKEDLPHTWCLSARDGGSKWHWRQWDEPRPLYLPGQALPVAGQTVVLVEGERKAAVLQELLTAGAPGVYTVASWPGGCKAWSKADWTWLAECSVLCWPDTDSQRVPLTPKERNACADDAAVEAAKLAKPYKVWHKQPGMGAMLGIGQVLRDVHGCQVQMLRIEQPGVMPDGWDAADAIEKDGWDFARVLAFFGTAYPLPKDIDALPDKPVDPAKKIDGPGAPGGGGSGGDGSGDGDGAADSGDLPWWLAPYYDEKKKRWNASRKTVIAALRHDERLKGVLGFNLLSNSLESRKEWPFPHVRKGKITGAVDLLLGDWLSSTFGMPAITQTSIIEAMVTIGNQNPWHPVREWLSLLQWDGVPRVNKWLMHVIGERPAVGDEPGTVPAERVEYFTVVGRCWLLGMVMRVMNPGSKFDYCPVLEGAGGLGKSTLVRVLAGPKLYSDTPFEIGKGNASHEQVQGVWLYEMGELSQMGKGEINAIKAFISSQEDRYRPAYGRVVEEFPRQCVLVGTTNENTYLRDRTGNRRFWPIPIRNSIKNAWLEKYRDQLFAEAYQLYLAGESCIPTPEQEARLFVPLQESRLVETAVTSELLAVLMRDPKDVGMQAEVNNLTGFVTLAQLAKALLVDAGKSTAGLESQIRSWMNQQGWEYCKKQVNGVRAWGWVRPAQWPALEDDAGTGPAAADAGVSAAARMLQELDDTPF